MSVRFLYADRVKETTATAGTGPLLLLGASPGYISFSSVASVSDYFRYTIVCPTTGAWEVGLGQLGPGPTIVRDKVESSTNAGAFVNFGSETKDVFLTSSADDFGHIHAFYFGSGSDGDRVIATGTTVTLSRDTYYQNLTISGTGLLLTAGWKLFVRGVLDITAVTVGGGIAYAASEDGAAGVASAGVGVPAGGAGGTGTPGVTVGGGVGGGMGGSGGAVGAAGSVGTGGTSAAPSNGGSGGAGGVGGADAAAGGTGGVAGAATLPLSIGDYRKDLNRGVVQILGGASGGGGGGGGGSVAAAGGGGGGGGASSGIVWISTRILRRTGAAAGSISSRGGDGGRGGDGFILTFVNPIASIFPSFLGLPPWPRSEFALPTPLPSTPYSLSIFPETISRITATPDGLTERFPLVLISPPVVSFPDYMQQSTHSGGQFTWPAILPPITEAFTDFPAIISRLRNVQEGQSVTPIREAPVAEAFTDYPAIIGRLRNVQEGQSVTPIREAPVAEAFTNFPAFIGRLRNVQEGQSVTPIRESPVAEAFTNFPAFIGRLRNVQEGQSVTPIMEAPVAEAFTDSPFIRRLRNVQEGQVTPAIQLSSPPQVFTDFPAIIGRLRSVQEGQVTPVQLTSTTQAFTDFPAIIGRLRNVQEGQSVAPVAPPSSPMQAFLSFPDAIVQPKVSVVSQYAMPYAFFPNNYGSCRYYRLLFGTKSVAGLWQDVARTTPVTANGQTIRAADNQAPASSAVWGSMTQAAGPTWQSTGATFSGSQWLQTVAGTSIPQAMTTIVVARITGGVGSFAEICDGVVATDRGAVILKDNTEKAGGYAGGSVVSLTHGWTTKALVTQVSSGTSSRLRWRQGSTIEDSGLISLGTNAMTGLTLGTSYLGPGTSPWIGDIEGIILFSGAIAGATLSQLEIDFANECGLVLT